MGPDVPDYLYTLSNVTLFILIVSVLTLIWLGAAHLSLHWKERTATAGILTAVLLVWLVLARYIAQQNFYWAPNNPTLPTLQFGLLLPVIIALVLLMRSARIARLIDAIPLSWLVGVQFYRVLGFTFLILWWGGYLPWQFALPTGIGDIATGIFALVVAAVIVRKLAIANAAAYAWCLFGIADLVVAVTMGTLTTSGLTHFVALDNPNLLVTAYPLVMIPTFAVPLSLILHGMCLWKLRRMAGGATTVRPIDVTKQGN